MNLLVGGRAEYERRGSARTHQPPHCQPRRRRPPLRDGAGAAQGLIGFISPNAVGHVGAFACLTRRGWRADRAAVVRATVFDRRPVARLTPLGRWLLRSEDVANTDLTSKNTGHNACSKRRQGRTKDA